MAQAFGGGRTDILAFVLSVCVEEREKQESKIVVL